MYFCLPNVKDTMLFCFLIYLCNHLHNKYQSSFTKRLFHKNGKLKATVVKKDIRYNIKTIIEHMYAYIICITIFIRLNTTINVIYFLPHIYNTLLLHPDFKTPGLKGWLILIWIDRYQDRLHWNRTATGFIGMCFKVVVLIGVCLSHCF